MKNFIILICCIVLISCKKENSDEPLCADPMHIHKVSANNYQLQEINYNEDCQLKESIERFSYKQYVYNAVGQLIKVEQKYALDGTSCIMQPGASGEAFSDPRKAPVGNYSEFEYNSQGFLLKKSNYYNNSGTFLLSGYQTYYYDNSVLDSVRIYNANGLLLSTNVYKFDDAGNLLSDDYYFNSNSGLKLYVTFTYEFDNHLNPYKVFASEGIPGKFSNTNNIIKETQKRYDSDSPYQYIITYTYQYNDLKYPVKVNDNIYEYGGE